MSELALTSPKETAKAAQAFADYVAMGPKRSLRKLCEFYHRNPTYLTQLRDWSVEYQWQERLKEMAAEQIAAAQDLKVDTYVTILGEYHRRVSDEPMRQVMKLEGLHGIYDRVKPETHTSSNEGLPSATITFQFEVVPSRAVKE